MSALTSLSLCCKEVIFSQTTSKPMSAADLPRISLVNLQRSLSLLQHSLYLSPDAFNMLLGDRMGRKRKGRKELGGRPAEGIEGG